MLVQRLWLGNVCRAHGIRPCRVTSGGPEEVVALIVEQFIIGIKVTGLDHVGVSSPIILSVIFSDDISFPQSSWWSSIIFFFF